MKDFLQEVENAGDAVIIAGFATQEDLAQNAKVDISELIYRLVPETASLHVLHAVFQIQQVAARVLLDTNTIRLKENAFQQPNAMEFA